jgi:small subunit ribosomal protein S4
LARYTGSVCRICRRENLKLFLKGDRCYSDKCAFDRRGFPPGQHGQGRRRKVSDYGIQLREKQKVKRMYGLSEKQFRLFFKRADRQKGITGTNLLVLLERRLDNVVYRLGFVNSRAQGRHFDNYKGVIKSFPVREDITMPIQEQLIVELYSK